jgi:hypothetical protein
MVIFCEVIAAIVLFIYSSFFEWFVHRYFMHTPRFPLKDAFRGHTLIHHQQYRDQSFSVQPGEPMTNVMLRWYAFPAMILGHMSIFALFQWATGLPIFWGASLGCTLYFTGYEYTHYLMHVPKGHFVERFGWYQFLLNHHRLHHKYMLRNLNVFVPIADICFGTLITAEGWRSRAKTPS